jgi:hypothetical protein
LRPDRLRVVVCGLVAEASGLGGAAWAVLQWVLGLRELGHEVLLVEPSGEAAGHTHDEVESFCADADLLLDIGGMLAAHPALFEAVPVRVYLDLDPVFTQLWHEAGIDMRLDGHTHFVTVGLNLGEPWITTLPPVVLSQWPVSDTVVIDAFTTVAHWRAFGTIERDGVSYGPRAHSWRHFLDLPARTSVPLLPALAIDPGEQKDIAALEEHGWRWLDPAAVAATPDAYRAVVQGSRGELGIAKHGYVVSRSGWFSDRSACYLASGRPVVAQDTGWSDHLPTGEGLFAFDDVDGAVAGLEAVAADPDRHRAAARESAEHWFDAGRALCRVIDAVGGGR